MDLWKYISFDSHILLGKLCAEKDFPELFSILYGQVGIHTEIFVH